MTYEQYWEQDSWLVKAYRKAQEIRRDEANFHAWLQGMYVYEAIADIAPILHAFAKKGTKARKYSEKPYEFKKSERKKKKEDPAKAASDRIQAKMLAFMKEHNKELARKRLETIRDGFIVRSDKTASVDALLSNERNVDEPKAPRVINPDD